MIKKIVAVLFVSFALFGCGKDPVLDLTNMDTYNESLNIVMGTLDSDAESDLEGVIIQITHKSLEEANGDKEKAFEIIRTKLNDKTVRQIFKENNVRL